MLTGRQAGRQAMVKVTRAQLATTRAHFIFGKHCYRSAAPRGLRRASALGTRSRPMSHASEDDADDDLPREQRAGLTRLEDDELRRLAFIKRFGSLSAEAQERLVQLRLKDRRKEIRPPRSGDPDPVSPEALRRVIPLSQRPLDDDELPGNEGGPRTS